MSVPNISKIIKDNNEIRSTFIYLFSTFVTRGISFLIIPLLTNIISPEEFGKLSLFEGYLNLTFTLILFSTPNYITKFYFEKEDVSIKIKHCLSINLILTLLLTIGLLVFSYFGNFILPIYVFLALPILGFFNAILETYLLLLRLKSHAYKYLKVEISKAFMETMLLLLLIIIFHLGWISKFYSTLSVSIILALYSFFKISEFLNFRVKINITELRKTFYFLVPLFIHSISHTSINVYDKIALERFAGLEDVAIYSVYNKFMSVSIIIIAGINKAFHPKMFNLLSMNYSLIFKRYIQYSVLFLVLIVFLIGLMVFTLDSYVIPTEYLRGSFLTPLFCIAYIFYGIFSVIFPIIISKGKVIFLACFTLMSAILNILINNLFNDAYGIYGAALGTVSAYFVLFFLNFMYSNYLVREWKKSI